MIQSRADKFLEGFKLGSLGISKKIGVSPQVVPFSEPQEEPLKPTFEIIKEGQNDLGLGTMGPYLYWKEEDGYSYFLRMGRNIGSVGSKFNLLLLGGISLKMEKSISTGNFLPKEGDWGGVFKPPKSLKEILSLFQEFVGLIKTHGIFGLVENGSMGHFDPNLKIPFYKTWLQFKMSGKKV